MKLEVKLFPESQKIMGEKDWFPIVDVTDDLILGDSAYARIIDETEKECEHENKTYQAKEWDTNVPESYTCDECGKDFDIPEPSFEDDVMEDEYEDK